jgi:sialate O-acetylesterase
MQIKHYRKRQLLKQNISKMKIRSLLSLLLLSVFTGFFNPCIAINAGNKNNYSVDSSLVVANIFQSNMVLQQNKPFAIWGNAAAGDKVVVKGDWTSKTITITADGQNYWRAAIPVPKAIPGDFTPHTLTVISGNKTITFTNLLIGEVWLASGQSNMQFGMKGEVGKDNGVINYDQEIADANYPNIRWLYVDLNFKAEPYDQVTGKWVQCSPETVQHFSGVAYFFARSLYRHLNVPVGIILSTIGASTGQAWTSRTELQSDTALYNKYLKPYDESPRSKEVINSGFSFEKVTRPTLLYNAMIHPLAGFSLRGFIWYQGEFNHLDKGKYTLLEQHMIKGWRDDFAEGDLPFYFVQMPSYYWNNNDPKAYDYALFREAQTNIRNKVSHTGMAVTIDDDVPRILHPRNKKPVGERLARIALNQTYKIDSIPYLGPEFKKMSIDGKSVKISFNKLSLDGGLTTNDNQAPKQFFIAGDDRIFHQATATINGDNIMLVCDSVAKPVAVRYSFTNMAVTNLVNKAGIPAEPFRTDNWEEEVNTPQIKLDYDKLNKGR